MIKARKLFFLIISIVGLLEVSLVVYLLWDHLLSKISYTEQKVQVVQTIAIGAQQKADQVQAQLTALTTTPFIKQTSDPFVERVTPPPGSMDPEHTIYAHPNDVYTIKYRVFSTRKANVIISSTFDGANCPTPQSITQTLIPGLNDITLPIQIPDNLQRYKWKDLDTLIFESDHEYVPPMLPPVKFFVVNEDVPLPAQIKPGVPHTVPLPPATPQVPVCQ